MLDSGRVIKQTMRLLWAIDFLPFEKMRLMSRHATCSGRLIVNRDRKRIKRDGGWCAALNVRLLMILLCAMGVQAAERSEPSDAALVLPLWELNLFNGAVRLPHYRGSDEYSLYALPLPYLIYRGDILKIDREGLKGVFRESDYFETGLSLGGKPPSYRDNQAREGMTDIGAIVEIGPMIQFFAAGRDRANPVYLAAAVRMAIAVNPDDLKINYQGIRSELKAVYRNRTLWKDQDASFGVSLGIDLADREYNGYIYDVAPDDVAASRPAYRTHGGYAGFSLTVSGQKTIGKRWSLGGYYQWENVSGSVCRDSPLVKTQNNHTLGCALIWNILRSKQTVRMLNAGR